MKTTTESLRKQGWEWAISFPEEKKEIYVQFESIGNGFKVGVLEKGNFKKVPYESVRHLFEEDRSLIH